MFCSSPTLFNKAAIFLCFTSFFFKFFDDIKISDPRIADLCIKAGQPTPFQVLCECLKRSVVYVARLLSFAHDYFNRSVRREFFLFESTRVYLKRNTHFDRSDKRLDFIFLRRNFGMGDTQIQMDVRAVRHQRSEFIMKVSKHEAKVSRSFVEFH
jgi:hypothetical protein